MKYTNQVKRCAQVVSDSVRPLDCSPPGSSVHGILQARILQWVAMPSSRGSSRPGIKTESPARQADSLPLSHQRSAPP